MRICGQKGNISSICLKNVRRMILTETQGTKPHGPRLTANGIAADTVLPVVTWNVLCGEWHVGLPSLKIVPLILLSLFISMFIPTWCMEEQFHLPVYFYTNYFPKFIKTFVLSFRHSVIPPIKLIAQNTIIWKFWWDKYFCGKRRTWAGGCYNFLTIMDSTKTGLQFWPISQTSTNSTQYLKSGVKLSAPVVTVNTRMSYWTFTRYRVIC